MQTMLIASALITLVIIVFNFPKLSGNISEEYVIKYIICFFATIGAISVFILGTLLRDRGKR